jgi:sarcosine oxidase, subunit gamma
MAEPQFRSALHHKPERSGAEGLTIGLREIDDRGMIDLRGRADDESFLGKVVETLGFDLPLKPRTSTEAGEAAALWLSVDQWLITCPRTEAPSLQARLAQALAGVHALAIDMSDARAIFRIEGDNGREVLNKGTSVDFTEPAIAAGFVRRIRYAEVAALVHVRSTAPFASDLYVFRSYAAYAWSFLSFTGRKAARVDLFGRAISSLPRHPGGGRGPA